MPSLNQAGAAISKIGLNVHLERLLAIDHLDLGPIKFKLMQEDEEGWSSEQVNITEKWYKRFLALCLKYPKNVNVPTEAVDIFWHYHILDTMKYHEDCQNVFGYYLHHFPYLGLRGKDDAERLTKAFNETSRLMFVEFGEKTDQLHRVFINKNYNGPADCGGCGGGGGCGGDSSCSTAPSCGGRRHPDDEIDLLARPTFVH